MKNPVTVKLFGEEVAVNAEIAFVPGKSGHADQTELLHWLAEFKDVIKFTDQINNLCDKWQ